MNLRNFDPKVLESVQIRRLDGADTWKVLDARPDIDDTWEEQVECSFEVTGQTSLVDWEGQLPHVLQLTPRTYRVRYSARGMLADWEAEPSPLTATQLIFEKETLEQSVAEIGR